MMEWLVIESSMKNTVFSPPEAQTPRGYIPRDAAEKLLGRDLGGCQWFSRDESEKLRRHPEWRDMEPQAMTPATPAPVQPRWPDFTEEAAALAPFDPFQRRRPVIYAALNNAFRRGGIGWRDAWQRYVSRWAVAAFGADEALSIPQRGIRLAEEAIETAQACGVPEQKLHDLIRHVYSQKPGELWQEIGGVQVCVMALAEAARASAALCEATEIARVTAKPLEHFAARNKAKNDLGFRVVEPPAA